MPYIVDKKNYQIKINGTTDYIKTWITEICNANNYGNYICQIQEKVDNLEKIVEPYAFTIGIHQRIYFNNNSILYAPNVSGEAKEFFFKALVEKNFEKARQKIEEN